MNEEKELHEMSKDEIREQIISLLEDDDEAFIEAAEAVDNENGLLGDERIWDMYEFIDFTQPQPEDPRYGGNYDKFQVALNRWIMNILNAKDQDGGKFRIERPFFRWNENGFTSVQDKAPFYRDFVDIEDLTDQLLEECWHKDVWSGDLVALMQAYEDAERAEELDEAGEE
jgi:hypothetical protein